MPPTSPAPEEFEVKRDVRVDHIGFVNELQKQLVDKLKEGVKASHEPNTRLEGDYFDARIVPATTRALPAKAWLKLLKAKEITEDEFVNGITVKVAQAEKTLDARTFNKLATVEDAEPRLVVTRKKAVELELVDAVRGLGKVLDPAPMRMAS